jgi:restriction endonuclease S subunit
MNREANEISLVDAANYVDEATLTQMKARAWPAGTVVFPKVGAALLTEKRRVLSTVAAFDNNVMGLIPGPRLRPRFLLSYMRTVRLSDFAQPGAVPSINQKHFTDLMLPVPTLEEQDEFVSFVGCLEELGQAARFERSALQETRAALLGDLLSGDHEIPMSYDALLGAV